MDMREYVSEMLAEFPVKFNDNGRVMMPAGNNLFKADSSKLLPDKDRELFHRTVAKALFLCKRGRPDIQTVVVVLCSRVRTPGRQEWTKLVRMMKFLHGTRDDVLTLSKGHGSIQLEWYVDASFAIHPDYRGILEQR